MNPNACAILLLAASLLLAPASRAGETARKERSGGTLREERTVVVNGVSERWRLEWAGKTGPACSPESGWDTWGTCPCAGFEFAEDGELDLVRVRPGVPEERLALTPLFRGQEAPGAKAVLRRWPVEKGDAAASHRPGFAERVRARPLAPVISLADYDHDGQATEFLLQVGAGPCGHRQVVAVGVDSRDHRLHAFTSLEKPREPLVLEGPWQWEKLLRSAGETTVTLVACGDHGSDEERTIHLRAGKDGIHARSAEKPCP